MHFRELSMFETERVNLKKDLAVLHCPVSIITDDLAVAQTDGEWTLSIDQKCESQRRWLFSTHS